MEIEKFGNRKYGNRKVRHLNSTDIHVARFRSVMFLTIVRQSKVRQSTGSDIYVAGSQKIRLLTMVRLSKGAAPDYEVGYRRMIDVVINCKGSRRVVRTVFVVAPHSLSTSPSY